MSDVRRLRQGTCFLPLLPLEEISYFQQPGATTYISKRSTTLKPHPTILKKKTVQLKGKKNNGQTKVTESPIKKG